jgi:MFS family permease/predicted Ser/Thr protein kinase
VPALTPLHPSDPERIGHYQLIGRLGEGGQGVVYAGRGPAGNQVAVKVLRTQVEGDDKARERFVRELAATERVAGFCTARVLDAEMDGDRPYIVSEYVPGPSLQEFLHAAGPQRGDDLVRLAIGTATALAAIHEAGIVHRDFKPPNVLMGPDGPRVIDFGIARALDTTATVTSHVIGTPAYMAPEQIAAHPVGPYTDMFAWGVTILFAATGVSPFVADSIPAIMHKVLYGQADVSALPEPLAGLVNACLSKNPAQRPTAPQVLLTLLGHSGAVPPGQMLPHGAAMAATRQMPPAWIPQPPPPRRLSGWLAVPPAAVAAATVGLGNNGLGTALPIIAADFHLTQSNLSWLTTGHAVGIIALVFPAARIADIAGRKLVLIAAAALFAVASILGGLSPTFGILLVAWSLQGVAAGVLAGASLAVLRAAFPASRMALPVGVWAAAVGLGTGAGPFLSIELMNTGNWRLPLYALAAPSLLAAALGAFLVRESRGDRDFPPLELLLPPALAAIVLGLSQSTSGWQHPITLLPLLFGVALLTLYAALARPPMLRAANITASAVMLGASAFATVALTLYVSIDLQLIQGRSVEGAFTTLLALAAASLLTAPLTALLLDRLDPRPLLALATALTAAAIVALALTSSTAPLPMVMTWLALAGIGITAVGVTAVTTMSKATPDSKAAQLGAHYQTAITAGSALGAALLSYALRTALTSKSIENLAQNYHHALQTTLWIAATAVLISAISTILIKSNPQQQLPLPPGTYPPPPPYPGPPPTLARKQP